MLEQLLARLARRRQENHLRRLTEACVKLCSEGGQANWANLAEDVVAAWQALPKTQHAAFFDMLATDFAPDFDVLAVAAKTFLDEPTDDHASQLGRAAEAPRQELIRRINRVQGGTEVLLDMRCALHACMRDDRSLGVVDRDFLHLLQAWFTPGFLRLQEVSWQSSAALLEQLIRYEAVHAIAGWDDLRRRLQPDRRCYAFFHPQLPGQPLIFVEVALLDAVPAAIGPLIDPMASPQPLKKPTTAVFYSISNCQPGLRGVSLGNFLIKRVAEVLGQELPTVKTFVTLSPVPGLVRWLHEADGAAWPQALRDAHARVQAWRTQAGALHERDIVGATPALVHDIGELCAWYLVHGSHQPLADPVARFHLDNGAQLERIHFAGDLSEKGLAQSLSVMVNYGYDLDKVEQRREHFLRQEVAHGTAVTKLLKHNN